MVNEIVVIPELVRREILDVVMTPHEPRSAPARVL